MRKLDTDAVKKIEFELLKCFRTVSESNGLYYTLAGGTLLGAVRHQGFIPWDDDIDVLMPRPDFDRLLFGQADLSSLPEYVKLISWKSGNSGMPFIKLIDTRTVIENRFFKENSETDHLWIDIFPTDGNPEDRRALKKLYGKSLRLRKILCLKKADPKEGKTKWKRMMKPLLVKALSFFQTEKLCEKIDAVSRTYDFDTSDYIGGVAWGYGPMERIRKAPFLRPVPVKFEGEAFNAPSNYDEYLSGLYGDYMTLPPEEKRLTHDMLAYIRE